MAKTAPTGQLTVRNAGDSDLEDDLGEDYKEVWFPSGESLFFLDLYQALLNAGYHILQADIAPTCAAWFFNLQRPKSLSRIRFIPHLSELLGPLGIQLRQENVAVEKIDNYLVVTIFWLTPASGVGRTAAWE